MEIQKVTLVTRFGKDVLVDQKINQSCGTTCILIK